jgi:hypothetical protein
LSSWDVASFWSLHIDGFLQHPIEESCNDVDLITFHVEVVDQSEKDAHAVLVCDRGEDVGVV